MEDDLTWLARNVHVWSDGMREVLVCYPRNVDALIWSYVASDAGWITKDQWLARRAELQNKPSWNGAPEWAEWLAQDEDGEWKWLGSNPSKYIDGWTANKLSCCKKVEAYGAVIEKGTILGDWRDTLEKRPEQDEFETFTGIEDSQEQDVTQQQETKQDNKWFERGELPPVGTECEFCGGTGDADDPWHPDLMDGDRVTVIAHFECGICTLAAFTFKSRNPNIATVLVEQANYGCFRPIRTERDMAVDEMMKCTLGVMNQETQRCLFEDLYDAGYRKQNLPAK